MIYVCGYSDKVPEDAILINTTSRSDNWSKGLSPFFLGPCELYDGYTSKNVENAWQFSKVYSDHVDVDGNIRPEYFEWAKEGWNNEHAFRYPMGKGRIPLFSYWKGEKLSYIEARKKIYIPIYAKALVQSDAFKHLMKLCETTTKDVYLKDFDGYDHVRKKMSFMDVVNNDKKSLGHAFVIWRMLAKVSDLRYTNSTKLF